MNENITVELITKESTTEESTIKEPTDEKFAVEEPATVEPTTEKSTTEESTIEEPTAENTAAEEPSAEDSKTIDLTNGEADKDNAEVAAKKTFPAPKQKVPKIDFDLFVPRVKRLKGKKIESFSDEEIVELALDKLTCDSYKALKGVENTPAIACWLSLYNRVDADEPDIDLARAICNPKKDFPGAMKFMLDKVKKDGSGGFEHTDLFDWVRDYYFAKEKPKKETKPSASPKSKASVLPAASVATVPKKEKAAKAVKPAPAPKKNEPLQLSLLGI